MENRQNENDHAQIISERKKIFNQSAFYSIAVYIRMFFKIIGGTIVAKLLGPSLFGVRNAFGLAIEYSCLSHLGTFDAMVREASFERGKDKNKSADQIVAVAFGTNFLMICFIGIMLIASSFFLKIIQWDIIYSDFIFFLGLIVITNLIKIFYQYKLILDKQLILQGKADILYGFLAPLICIPLVYYYSLRGLFIGLLVADLLQICYLLKLTKGIPKIGLSASIFFKLIKIGFPVMLIGILLVLFGSADRIIIIKMLSEESLGFFGLGTIIINVIIIIPAAVKSAITPRLMEKYSKTQDVLQIKSFFIDPTLLLNYFLPFLIGIVYFCIHLPIDYFLTKYAMSIDVVKILSIGSYFIVGFSIANPVCYALNKQNQIVFLIMPAIIMNFSISYLFIRLGWGINGVALGTCLSYFVFSTLTIVYTLYQFRSNFFEIFRFLMRIYIPFVYFTFLLMTIDHYFVFSGQGLLADVIFSLKQIIIFFICYSLVFILIWKSPAITKLVANFTQQLHINTKKY